MDAGVRSAVLPLGAIGGGVFGIALAPTAVGLGVGGSNPTLTTALLGAAVGMGLAALLMRPRQHAVPIAGTATPPDTATPADASTPADALASNNSALLEKVRSVENQLSPLSFLMRAFILFFFASGAFSSLSHFAILAAVIAFHEAGHALGMKAFGYHDVRVFFIPFLGAATQGTRDAGPAWREGIVLLLGPIPGLILGVTLAAVARANENPTLAYAAQLLIWVNGFNLLPFTPLDGARLLDLVLFGRHRLAAAYLQGLFALGFALFAIQVSNYVLGIVAFLQLYGIHRSSAVATAAAGTAATPLTLPTRYADTTPELLADVNQRLDPSLGGASVDERAVWIRLTLDRAFSFRHSPGVLASAALLVAWGSGVLMMLVGLVAIGWDG